MTEHCTYQQLVFYDGDCGFCNSTVQFILRNRKSEFYFIPLQSLKAKELIGQRGLSVTMDTIYFLKDDNLYQKSGAALQICRGLNWKFKWIFLFYYIPAFLRDPFYNWIAKRRHRLRSGYCVIPAEHEKKYFVKSESFQVSK